MELESANDHNRLVKRCQNVVLILCLLGGLRIFLFCAVFPFFNNVDEGTHFDLIYKYSKGHIFHRGIEKYDAYSAKMFILYGSPEYLFPNLQIPKPYWQQSDFINSDKFNKLVEIIQNDTNYEAGSPPFYYITAGIWYKTGAILGFSDGTLLYWTRFLNIPVFIALIWVSWQIARICFSDIYQQIAVPLFITFFPQDVFYSINPDALSPLLFALFSLMLLRIYLDNKSWDYYLIAGLIGAALFLTRMPNISVCVLVLAITLFKIKNIHKDKPFARSIIYSGILLTSFALPVGLWMLRNYSLTGSFTGASDKIKFWGWTLKPFNQLWNHPFFIGNGFSHFFIELTKSFWRGELVWHFKPISSSSADLFYIVSSALFFSVCVIALISGYKKVNHNYRIIIVMSFITIGASVFLLAFSSLLYDFHNSFTPSRASPFFIAGRVISSVILPFAIIYIDGYWKLFGLLSRRYAMMIIILILVAITISEFWMTKDVFSSQYNFFALLTN
jgi:hypothetical protein